MTIPNTQAMVEPEEKKIASPRVPVIMQPRNPEVGGRQVEDPDSMGTENEIKQQFVTPRIDAVALKKSPDESSPKVATANKGDRLVLVGRTTILYNDKPWLIVKKGKLTAFVWEPLVKIE